MPTTPLPQIGLPVIGGSTGGVLYCSSGEVLAIQSSRLFYDDANGQLVIGDRGAISFSAQPLTVFGNRIETHRFANNTVAAGFNVFHGRGSASAPLRTQAGDGLAVLNAFGYQAADDVSAAAPSTGSAKGLFGFRAAEPFSTTAQGAEFFLGTASTGVSTATVRLSVLSIGHPVWTELTLNPSTVHVPSLAAVSGPYMKADKLVFAYNNAGEMTYVSLALDGATTTWVHSTAAP